MKMIHFIVYLYHSFFKHDCANRAASLAYTTLLSIVPLVMLSFWILSLFPAFTGTGQLVQTFIINNFVAHSAQVISEQLSHFMEHVKVLSWSSLIALTVVSVLMIYDMVSAFNSIWQVQLSRHFVLSFSFYSLLLIFAPIFFGIFMVFSSYLATMPFISNIAFLEKPMVYILPYIVAFLIFTFFNWALPSCKVPFRNAVWAGLFTTILFEITKYLFSLYMSYFPTYKLIYGALATIPIFLLWIYLSWVIILIGAVICATMTRGLPSGNNQ